MRQKRLHPRTTLLALALCAPLAFAACGGGPDASNTTTADANAGSTPAPAASAQPSPKPKMQEVVATVDEVKLDAGGAGEATITLDIAEGYHVHSNPASDKFYIATEVKATPQEGLTPGKPAYPKAVTHKFEFSDKPLSVYEGRAVIRLPLGADKTASKGRHTLNTTIRVQPCNDQVCLPPRDINAPIPVVVN
jgi:thiol:disulfide interchange protein DsbD